MSLSDRLSVVRSDLAAAKERRQQARLSKKRAVAVRNYGAAALTGKAIGAYVGAIRSPVDAAIGYAVGGASGRKFASKDVKLAMQELNRVASDPNATAKQKAKAGEAFAAMHPHTARLVLPKNAKEQEKLANRSHRGHAAHRLLRSVPVLGANLLTSQRRKLSYPGVGMALHNAGRYNTKVAFAKAGIHRNEAPRDFMKRKQEEDMYEDIGAWLNSEGVTREDLIYGIIEATSQDPEERRAARNAKLKKWGKRAAIGAGVIGAGYLASRTKPGIRLRHAAGKKMAVLKWHAAPAGERVADATTAARAAVGRVAADVGQKMAPVAAPVRRAAGAVSSAAQNTYNTAKDAVVGRANNYLNDRKARRAPYWSRSQRRYQDGAPLL